MNRTHVSAEVKEFPGKMSLPNDDDSLKLSNCLSKFGTLASGLSFQNSRFKVRLPVDCLAIPS